MTNIIVFGLKYESFMVFNADDDSSSEDQLENLKKSLEVPIYT